MEVLSRGKTSKGEWVYGDLVHPKSNYVFGNHSRPIDDKYAFILTTCWVHGGRFCSNGVCWVLSETVGQYTGLTDKNGNKIFEGDVFEEREYETRGVVVFENGAFKIKWYGVKTVLREYGYDDNGGWDEIETESFDMYYINQMEVIGNIHDNPTLISGENNYE